MEFQMTEEEQIIRIKKWLKEYAPTILISLVIVVVGTFGWRYWQKHQVTEKANAVMAYEQLLENMLSQNDSVFVTETKQLVAAYPGTPYAALAKLLLAKYYVSKGQIDLAKAQLTWVMKKANTPNLRQIGRDRLAKLLLSQNQASVVIKLLSDIDDKTYLPIIAELRGDAYVQMNQIDQARKAYSKSISVLPHNSASRALVEMKLADLPV